MQPTTAKDDHVQEQQQHPLPVWQHDPREDDLTDAEADFLFDLRGFRVVRGAVSPSQLERINGFVDEHPIDGLKPGDWIGNVEAHTYGAKDGVNFQNVIEGGDAFEELIDNPAWVEQIRRYVEVGHHHLTIDENFLNVRASGGFIPVHSGGALQRFTSVFRTHAGEWMVGQINVLMALTDVGPGDGATTVIPGSHKSAMQHPVEQAEDGTVAWQRGISGADTVGMVEVHLRAGDALMFTDAIMHGSTPRTNPGYRRVLIYRYAPHLLAPRFNYVPSEELLERLTTARRRLVQGQPPRLRPGRSLTTPEGVPPTDFDPSSIK